MSPTRSRVIAYGVIALLGLVLAAYGLSPIRPSRHGFNELLTIGVGLVMAAVGVVALIAIGIRAATRSPSRDK